MSDKAAPDALWLKSLDDAIRGALLAAALSAEDKAWAQDYFEKQVALMKGIFGAGDREVLEQLQLRRRATATSMKVLRKTDLSVEAKEWCRRRVRNGVDREIISRVYGISTKVMNIIDSDKSIVAKGGGEKKRKAPGPTNGSKSETSSVSESDSLKKRPKTKSNRDVGQGEQDKGTKTKVHIYTPYGDKTAFTLHVPQRTTGSELKARIKSKFPGGFIPDEFALMFKNASGKQEELLDTNLIPAESDNLYLDIVLQNTTNGTDSEDSRPDTSSESCEGSELDDAIVPVEDDGFATLSFDYNFELPFTTVHIETSNYGRRGFEITVWDPMKGSELKANLKSRFPQNIPTQFGLRFKHPIGNGKELLDDEDVPCHVPDLYLILELRLKATGEVGKRGCESGSDDDDCSSIPEPSAVRDCGVSKITEAVASLLLLANPPPCPAVASDPAKREAAAETVSEEANMPSKAALRTSPDVMDAHLSGGDSAMPPDQLLTGQFKTEACEKASDKGAEEDRHGNLQRWLSQRFQSPIPTPAVNDRIDQFGGCTDPATETSTSSEHDEKKGPCLWFTISCKGKSDVPRSISTRAVSTNADLTIGSDRRMLKKISQGEMSDEINRGNRLSLLLGLSDMDLSHRHCRIFYQDGKWFVEKLGKFSASVYRYRENGRLRVEHGHPEQLCDKDHVVINKSYRLVCHMSEI